MTTRPYPAPPPLQAPIYGALLVLCLLFTAGGSQAQTDTDPPDRVAWLGDTEGFVQVAPADTGQWRPTERNRPLAQGDQIAAGSGARAELHSGSTVLRLQGTGSLEFTALDPYTTQIKLPQGSLIVRLRALSADERLEVDTPNLAFVASQPGEYRFDVNPGQGDTRVLIRSGAGVVYGAQAEAISLGETQQATFTGRSLAQTAAVRNPAPDAFDQWAWARDRQDEQSVSARYVSREVTGYQQLDRYGDWAPDTSYGPVWFPRAVEPGWAPYRDGQWQWVAPWGFAPSHYGRWIQVGTRWGWTPGPQGQRPVYAPALVDYPAGSGAHNPNRPPRPPQRPGDNDHGRPPPPWRPPADIPRPAPQGALQGIPQFQQERQDAQQRQLRELQQRFQPQSTQRPPDGWQRPPDVPQRPRPPQGNREPQHIQLPRPDAPSRQTPEQARDTEQRGMGQRSPEDRPRERFRAQPRD